MAEKEKFDRSLEHVNIVWVLPHSSSRLRKRAGDA